MLHFLDVSVVTVPKSIPKLLQFNKRLIMKVRLLTKHKHKQGRWGGKQTKEDHEPATQ